ncbi:hypothetical protein MNQ96_13485 [Sphingopyxis granuli]|uniref:hypothetical protein n=1 Tax=Sphingopyxis granuli TaxID=267128 RepID=UPI001F52FE42|nr:hypothetical protein [Sphingopyxis granuli]UNK81423.1 hypothetical protein MNQ96_13485 [Sphingopyxis granuli]
MISANIGALAGELDINRMVVGGTKRIFKFVMRCAMQIVICPLLSGPKLMIFWTTKENMNAGQEASPGRDYRQAA